MIRAFAAALLILAVLPGAAAAACRDEQGARLAADYLRQCRDVGAACRPSASCPALVEAIRRGCETLGTDAPNVCGLYVEEEEDDDEE